MQPPPGDSRFRHDPEVIALFTSGWRRLAWDPLPRPLDEVVQRRGENLLDQAQVRALLVLVSRGPLDGRDLAGALGVDPAAADRAVEQLRTAGLAERRRSTQDGRRVLLAATESGARRVADLEGRSEAVLATVLEAFTPAEVETLGAYLHQLADAIGEWLASGAGLLAEPDPRT
jgi:DNA-binding MarR family transcriptional regulator